MPLILSSPVTSPAPSTLLPPDILTNTGNLSLSVSTLERWNSQLHVNIPSGSQGTLTITGRFGTELRFTAPLNLTVQELLNQINNNEEVKVNNIHP